MKIAITGGTAGIGQALGDIYETQGHEVLRLSRRTGHNIRVIPKVAAVIEPCDMFINNAQVGYAQTELLFDVAKRWKGSRKTIINISTAMTQYPLSSLPGVEMMEYRLQKVALEEAVKQLRHAQYGIRLIIVRPGVVKTQPDQQDGMDPDIWAREMIDIIDRNQSWIDDVTIHSMRKFNDS